MTLEQVIAGSVGGVFIGVSAAIVLFTTGRIAGISGIVGNILGLQTEDLDWRVAFLLGLLVGGVGLLLWDPSFFGTELVRSPYALVAAGLLVGFGVRMGNGCTSGHGVCGMGRLSPRSTLATVTFMAAGVLMAAIVTQALGGRI